MNWLLDTNVCIAALNPRSTAVRGRFSEAVNRGDFLGISAITVFELHYGAVASSRVADNTRRLSIFLASLPEIPLESEDARVAGTIRAELRKNGTPIGPYDVLIAGQALRRELVLVTANIGEFARVAGLRVENWAG